MERRQWSYHIPLLTDTWMSRRLQFLLDTEHKRAVSVIDDSEKQPQTIEHILKALSLTCNSQKPGTEDMEHPKKPHKLRKQLTTHRTYKGFDVIKKTCENDQVTEVHYYLRLHAFSPAVHVKNTILQLDTVENLVRYMTQSIGTSNALLQVTRSSSLTPTWSTLPSTAANIAQLYLQVLEDRQMVVNYVFRCATFTQESHHVGSLIETLQRWQQSL